ncbi:hypothetical protein ABW19_dt0205787 [Dactylella cylindrospora]|nr:hypothetical protein ABW19_dt0205787 [Dactylella cylindrospora]
MTVKKKTVNHRLRNYSALAPLFLLLTNWQGGLHPRRPSKSPDRNNIHLLYLVYVPKIFERGYRISSAFLTPPTDHPKKNTSSSFFATRGDVGKPYMTFVKIHIPLKILPLFRHMYARTVGFSSILMFYFV